LDLLMYLSLAAVIYRAWGFRCGVSVLSHMLDCAFHFPVCPCPDFWNTKRIPMFYLSQNIPQIWTRENDIIFAIRFGLGCVRSCSIKLFVDGRIKESDSELHVFRCVETFHTCSNQHLKI
jgi:hypothetical protein